jgi:hypothetical protein
MSLRNRIFFVIASIFWISVYVFVVKVGLDYDRKKMLEAQELYGIVNDSSAEAYYP